MLLPMFTLCCHNSHITSAGDHNPLHYGSADYNMGGVGGEKTVNHIEYTGQLISIEKCYKYVQVQGPNTLSQMDTLLEIVIVVWQ